MARDARVHPPHDHHHEPQRSQPHARSVTARTATGRQDAAMMAATWLEPSTGTRTRPPQPDPARRRRAAEALASRHRHTSAAHRPRRRPEETASPGNPSSALRTTEPSPVARCLDPAQDWLVIVQEGPACRQGSEVHHGLGQSTSHGSRSSNFSAAHTCLCETRPASSIARLGHPGLRRRLVVFDVRTACRTRGVAQSTGFTAAAAQCRRSQPRSIFGCRTGMAGGGPFRQSPESTGEAARCLPRSAGRRVPFESAEEHERAAEPASCAYAAPNMPDTRPASPAR